MQGVPIDAHIGPFGISDHAILTATILGVASLPKCPFKFLNVWCEHPLFAQIIADSCQINIVGCQIFQVVQKLKALKKPLRALHFQHFSKIGECVRQLCEELVRCQDMLQLDPCNAFLGQQEKMLLQQ